MDQKLTVRKEFSIKMRGYACAEVDAHLDSLAQRIEAMEAREDELKSALSDANGELSYLRGIETALRDAMVSAQQIGTKLEAEARAQAETIVAQAQTEADALTEESHKTLEEAQNRADQLLNEAKERAEVEQTACQARVESRDEESRQALEAAKAQAEQIVAQAQAQADEILAKADAHRQAVEACIADYRAKMRQTMNQQLDVMEQVLGGIGEGE